MDLKTKQIHQNILETYACIYIYQDTIGYQDTRIPGYQDTRIPGFQDIRIPGYQNTRIPGH